MRDRQNPKRQTQNTHTHTPSHTPTHTTAAPVCLSVSATPSSPHRPQGGVGLQAVLKSCPVPSRPLAISASHYNSATSWLVTWETRAPLIGLQFAPLVTMHTVLMTGICLGTVPCGTPRCRNRSEKELDIWYLSILLSVLQWTPSSLGHKHLNGFPVCASAAFFPVWSHKRLWSCSYGHG